MSPSHRSDDRRLEDRRVEVADPDLPADVNRRLTEEVREVIGVDRVRVPADRAHPSHGERVRPSGAFPFLDLNRVILLFGVAIGVVVGLIIALTTRHWWLLPVAFVVLVSLGLTVTRMIAGVTAIRDHPDPTTVAILDEQGVDVPEQRFSAIVEEFTPDEGADDETRTVSVEDDPAKAAAEQRSALTATGGPSRPRIRRRGHAH